MMELSKSKPREERPNDDLVPKYDERIKYTLIDVGAMLRHMSMRGIPMSESLQEGVARLLKEQPPSDLLAALRVHAGLCEALAPVTPETIRHSNWGNTTLKAIAFVGFFSFLLFVAPSLIKPTIQWEALASALSHAQVLGAAGMGASFYALYTASKYLRSSTFDPQYNQIYLIRTALGILAGFILGNFAQNLGLFSSESVEVMGTTTLGLLGGFSSEAVAQILKRVSDTLVAMVRGSGEERARAESDALIARTRTVLAAELQSALELDDQEQRQLALRQLIKTLHSAHS